MLRVCFPRIIVKVSANSHVGVSLVVGLLTGLPVALMFVGDPGRLVKAPQVNVGIPAAYLGNFVNAPLKLRVAMSAVEMPGAPWIAIALKCPKRKLLTL